MTARRTVATLALGTGMSLLYTVPAAAVPDNYVRNCKHTAGGVPLRIQLSVQFAGERTDNIKKVAVRVTDAEETGAFADGSAQLKFAQVEVLGPDDKTSFIRTYKNSPISVKLTPTGNGRDVAKVTVTANWQLPKKRTASVTCFYLDG